MQRTKLWDGKKGEPMRGTTGNQYERQGRML